MYVTSYSTGIDIVFWFLLSSYIRFHLTHANGTHNRPAANSITSKSRKKQTKSRLILLLLLLSSRWTFHYNANLILQYIIVSPVSHGTEGKFKGIVSRPINARKLLFNTRADFTVVLPEPLENCIEKNK